MPIYAQSFEVPESSESTIEDLQQRIVELEATVQRREQDIAISKAETRTERQTTKYDLWKRIELQFTEARNDSLQPERGTLESVLMKRLRNILRELESQGYII